jgi:hypothetical protein
LRLFVNGNDIFAVNKTSLPECLMDNIVSNDPDAMPFCGFDRR